MSWRGLYKKSVAERQGLASRHAAEACGRGGDGGDGVVDDELVRVLESGGLSVSEADRMVENCVGVLGVPLGVNPNVCVNGRAFVVPMATEEPSVIAAASSACKLVANSSVEQGMGFEAQASGNVMTAQVQLVAGDADAADFDAHACVQAVEAVREQVMVKANEEFCASMVKRGGGVVDVSARVLPPRAGVGAGRQPSVVVHIDVDVCDAMGANLLNTIAEGVSPMLEEATSARATLRILTNLCLKRTATARFRIPVEAMAWKGVDGGKVCERVLEAYYFAEDDVFRATTNNKGIMNGMDAVALATGQDWRAIEAAAHAFAARSGEYRPLAQYRIEDGMFIGEMEMPIAVGTVGGALGKHPVYKFAHQLMGKPDAQTLAQITVCVGLAQNFAAIRALAIEGIQRGHMALHARKAAI